MLAIDQWKRLLDKLGNEFFHVVLRFLGFLFSPSHRESSLSPPGLDQSLVLKGGVGLGDGEGVDAQLGGYFPDRRKPFTRGYPSSEDSMPQLLGQLGG